jgi:hypothetical protein
MPYFPFKPNNPGCNVIQKENDELLNEFLSDGENGKSKIETIYKEAFPKGTNTDAKAMVNEIMGSVQSQAVSLTAALKKLR